ncbi:hypothetical protein H4R33_001446 [Dimargaris cristalligena]|uniref:Translation initiation factor eIF2B subunit delta n=1 Tax=Dimargaris cristalligena TaxID=215637 RepID=A0A4P9ZY36_9FUNG|nr:hypothetical protein H4R33_001446 [Dimargaris cristalligena]RKP37961.1 hypothetical protein BJ085DRAFT_21446 [Dimargaris cristalligena]|eukprot:RKP37961.1 hypothetical protein BJ085DRAFT_21446 [Dimargaris cristalligena]
MSNSASSSPRLPSASNTPKPKAKAPKSEKPAKQAPKNAGPGKAAKVNNASKGGAASSSSTPAAKKISPLFAHLEEREYPATTAQAPSGVHPCVRSLGLQFAELKICGSTARCLAMLNAFKQVIEDYQTPSQTTLCRHLPTYLSIQISYLVSMRPMAVTMGNAIRFLKYHISILDIDLPESDAKGQLIEKIDEFIRDRITAADRLIVQYGLQKIQDGDVVLTYACSSIVKTLLIAAHQAGIQFRVIVIDSRPLLEGLKLLRDLATAGLACTYAYINSISSTMKEATKVFLGTHAVLANGALFSRAGTALVAMTAHRRNIPVIVFSEIYKFTERVQLDSVVMNELGDPHDLAAHKDGSPIDPAASLTNWKSVNNLNLLTLMYDVTPTEYLSMAITEVGMIPFTSVPVVLREYRL